MIQEINPYLGFPIKNEPAMTHRGATSIVNYSEILGQYGIDFSRAGNYLEVGEISWLQGWILDIGVISAQVVPLLESILPLLIQENVPFRLVRNLEIANSILGGQLGLIELGKIISIFPRSDDHGVKLAGELIGLTGSFKGPEILTDRQLGGVISTRYGACKPIIRINQQNSEERFINDPAGNLVKEPLSIPFQLPQGVYWPFDAIVPAEPTKKESVLQDRYKPVSVLKKDAKGSVRKGLMLQKFYKINWCVIKEGRYCMSADEFGRDIHDRLEWQYELQKDLQGYVPVPKVYDFFRENDNSYVVMEFIQGIPLNDTVPDIIRGRLWPVLPLRDRLLALNYALQILAIIETMHRKGYIHRDIQPNNFLVDKHQRLWLIDLELAYSEKLQKPFPPFRLGTWGFMSPEQVAQETPTQAQDIYAIGAILVFLLTGLFPNGFSMGNQPLLNAQLLFFIKDEAFVESIVDCLSYDQRCRPSLAFLKSSLQEFRNRQKDLVNAQNRPVANKIDRDQLNHVINNALLALATPDFVNADHLWNSKKMEDGGLAYEQSKAVSVYTGFSKGLSGIIYVLSRAHQAGFSIESCMVSYRKSLAYIRRTLAEEILDGQGGLYTGTAGVWVALLEAFNTGIVPEKMAIQTEVLHSLKNTNLESIGMADRIVEKGLAMLYITESIENSLFAQQLKNLVDELLGQQQRDGSWICAWDNRGRPIKITGWAYGMAGIIYFLMKYLKSHPDHKIALAVTKALDWLVRQSHTKNRQLFWCVTDRSKEVDNGMLNGFPGIILCLIKAYETFGSPLYRQTAEVALGMMPELTITNDLTLANGASGIGELYLEAGKIFKSEQWLVRAYKITEFLLHYFVCQKDGGCYWLPKDNKFATADLFDGNSGIIHFLLRSSQYEHLNHPLTII